MSKNEVIEIPILTRREQYQILKAANRAKKEAEANGPVAFVTIFFMKGEMIFSESRAMKRVFSTQSM